MHTLGPATSRAPSGMRRGGRSPPRPRAGSPPAWNPPGLRHRRRRGGAVRPHRAAEGPGGGGPPRHRHPEGGQARATGWGRRVDGRRGRLRRAPGRRGGPAVPLPRPVQAGPAHPRPPRLRLAGPATRAGPAAATSMPASPRPTTTPQTPCRATS